MNDASHRMKLNHQKSHEQGPARQTESRNGTVEFQTAEEMLRHDAATVDVPEGIAGRLAESAGETHPAPWWKRWF